jgi:predicted PurR-regulated permease PerM
LSVLLAFVLSPALTRLEKIGLGRPTSVSVVIVLALIVLTTVGWIAGSQINTLAGELPSYRENIMQKIRDLRGMSKGGALEKVQETVEDVREEIDRTKPSSKAKKPLPVVVQPASWRSLYLGTLVQPLASATLVFGLVIFMLAQREELRNRLIRVIGYGNLTVTTKGLEEAGQRISRYLLTQVTINGSFGAIVSLALFLIGVPYAFLWGLLAVPLLFIPVIGFWAATALPTVLALAVFKDWWWPLVVIGLFLGLKTVNNMLLEPLLYGKSIGVSPVPLLVMIAFWTWLWGPIGLIAATPLTVCLVVFAKYVPQLEFIRVLLSDDPVMEANISYYQRLLAVDRDEAAAIVHEYRKTHSPEQLYDEVLLPALSHAKQDRLRGNLGEAEERFILEATQEILDDLSASELPPENGPASSDAEEILPTVRIMGCPARDASDELALRMLRQLLPSKHYQIDIISAEALTSEVIASAGQKNPDLICITVLAPGGLAQARHLCKRLRLLFPKLKIVVGRWGTMPDSHEARSFLIAAGADQVGNSLAETRDQILKLRQLIPAATAT